MTTREASTNGLVAAQVLDGSGGARSVGWRDIRSWGPERGSLWVHLDRHGAESRRWGRERSGLDGIIVKDLLADASRPSIIPLAEGTLIDLRGVNTNAEAEPEDMVWVQMWLESQRLVTIRQRRVAAVQDIREALASHSHGPLNVGDICIRLAERLLDRMDPVISQLEAEMDGLSRGGGRRASRAAPGTGRSAPAHEQASPLGRSTAGGHHAHGHRQEPALR